MQHKTTILWTIIAVVFIFTECQQKKEPISVIDVTLSQSSLDMIEGDCQILTETIEPSNAENKSVSWSSSQSSIASVQEGIVTAHKAGSATITVKTVDGNKTAKCEVIVKSKVIPVESVFFNKSYVELMVDDEITLTVTVTPENASNKNVSWSSSAPSVASVADGKVTALKAGKAIITVKTEEGGKTASCEIDVVAIKYGENESMDEINGEW